MKNDECIQYNKLKPQSLYNIHKVRICEFKIQMKAVLILQ